jgi:hypothetical protein
MQERKKDPFRYAYPCGRMCISVYTCRQGKESRSGGGRASRNKWCLQENDNAECDRNQSGHSRGVAGRVRRHTILQTWVTLACRSGLLGGCCGSSGVTGADSCKARDRLKTSTGKCAGPQNELRDAATAGSDGGHIGATTAVGGGNNGADGGIGEGDGTTNTVGGRDVIFVIVIVVVVVVVVAIVIAVAVARAGRAGGHAGCRARGDNFATRINLNAGDRRSGGHGIAIVVGRCDDSGRDTSGGRADVARIVSSGNGNVDTLAGRADESRGRDWNHASTLFGRRDNNRNQYATLRCIGRTLIVVVVVIASLDSTGDGGWRADNCAA